MSLGWVSAQSKRKRVACTKYDGDYAVAMPSKGGRVKAQQVHSHLGMPSLLIALEDRACVDIRK